ncbi:MAG: hypothetical protein N5P05_002151 [Chroococcopsis gigantea SAG 12.99]|jgi:hypothetical protein|nr:hypothetical protein [Chlorogloea purpurea SAG 13.99]MDV3000545.1 hypothetical protein [Chroococcopsis gigantea SAG 12.99]
MSAAFHTLGPLSVGNVINAALRLYKDNYKIYLPIALQAGLWSLLPTVVELILTGVLFKNTESTSFVRLLVFPLQIFSTAKFLSLAAVIARLAFQQLIYRPETPVEAKAPVIKKMWQFLFVQAQISLLIFIAIIALGIVGAIVVSISTVIPLLAVILVPAFIVLMFLALTIVYARIIIPEVCLAVEDNLTAFKAIKRSWELTAGLSWRIVSIISIAFLVTIPLYILASVPFWLALVPLFGEGAALDNRDIESASAQGVIFGVLIFSVLNILALPFWQALKGVIYYDLRNRKEGLELTIEDGNL